MALVTYRVWYGCRVDNVAYKRGIVVQLDDTSASVQYNVSKGRLRPTADELADNTVDTDTIIDGTVSTADIAPSETDGQVLTTVAGAVDWVTPTTIAVDAIATTAVDAKGDLLAATADNTVARLAVGADGQHLVADSSATAGVAYQSIGNLLTENQASVETDTTGWSGSNATLAQSATYSTHGTYSLEITVTRTDTGTASTPTGGAGIPVTPGATYTARCDATTGVGTRTVRCYISFYQSNGTFISTSVGSYTAVGATGTFSPVIATAVAPANAAYAAMGIQAGGGGSINDTVYADKIGFWAGAGGLWQLPSAGTPIANLGIKSDATGVYVWNDYAGSWTAV